MKYPVLAAIAGSIGAVLPIIIEIIVPQHPPKPIEAPTLLMLDDDPKWLAHHEQWFKAVGLVCHTTRLAAEAIQLVQHDRSIQFALVDELLLEPDCPGTNQLQDLQGHDVLRAIHHHRPDIRLIVVTSQLLQRQHSNPQKGLLANFKWRLRQASGKGTNLLNKLFQVLIESSDPEKQFIETVASLRQPGVIGILNKQEIEQNADRAYDSILAQIRNFSSSDCGRED